MDALVPGRISTQAADHPACKTSRPTRTVFWLQGLTLGWMLVECSVSGYAAVSAHSPAILAFGSDSLVELLSAAVVLLQWSPRMRVAPQRAARLSAALLGLLAGFVALLAGGALLLHVHPRPSLAGIGITLGALLVMPLLAAGKRREARRLRNAALAADAVQSATCAYLAALVLVGLAAGALFHQYWIDPVAALAAIPLLVKEARAAWRGQGCCC